MPLRAHIWWCFHLLYRGETRCPMHGLALSVHLCSGLRACATARLHLACLRAHERATSGIAKNTRLTL